VSSIELLSFEASTDRLTTLVQIPQTGRYYLVRRRLKKTVWVDKMFDGMIPVSSDLDEIALTTKSYGNAEASHELSSAILPR
jgi:hypothetical protein